MSWASLWWVVRREAALRLLYPGALDAPSRQRAWIAGKSSTQLARLVTYKLNHPGVRPGRV